MLTISLLFLFLGVFYNLAGVATPSVAAKFSVEPYLVGYAFSLYAVGQTVAVMGNRRFLHSVSPQREIKVASVLVVTAIIGLTYSPYLLLFAISALACGLGAGIFVSVGNHTCISVWQGQERAAKLNLINFFFSFGAIISPVVAGWLLAKGHNWANLYWWSSLVVVLAAAFSRHVPVAIHEKTCQPSASAFSWPSGVYLSAAALFAYVLSEVIVSFWLVSYLQQHLDLELARSTFFLSAFWGAIAVGRFFSGFLARRFAVVHMVLAGSAIAFISFVGLLLSKDASITVVLTVFTGLGYSCLYASILAFGTQSVSPSPAVTTFYVSVGCAGGILSYVVSSLLNQLFSLQTTMAFAAGLIGTVFLLIAAAAMSQGNGKRLYRD